MPLICKNRRVHISACYLLNKNVEAACLRNSEVLHVFIVTFMLFLLMVQPQLSIRVVSPYEYFCEFKVCYWACLLLRLLLCIIWTLTYPHCIFQVFVVLCWISWLSDWRIWNMLILSWISMLLISRHIFDWVVKN